MVWIFPIWFAIAISILKLDTLVFQMTILNLTFFFILCKVLEYHTISIPIKVSFCLLNFVFIFNLIKS